MPKYHVNPTSGDVGSCKAEIKCPFGHMELEHFVDKDKARRQAELLMEFEVLKTTPPKSRKILKGDEHILEYYSSLHEHFSHLPSIEGGNRVTYFRGDGTVVKVPKTDEGETANSREANWSKKYGKTGEIPIAEAHWESLTLYGEEIDFLVMEEVRPTIADYKTYPDWIGFVDCAQVGFDKNGVLLAYDL